MKQSVGGSRVFTSFFGEIIDVIKHVAVLLCFMMITETDHFTLSGHITSHCSCAGKYSRAEWEESMFPTVGVKEAPGVAKTKITHVLSNY